MGFYFHPTKTGLPLSLKQAKLALPQCFCIVWAHWPCPLFAFLPLFLLSSLCPIRFPLHLITCNTPTPCPTLFFPVQTLFYILIRCLFTVCHMSSNHFWSCFTFCHHLEENLQISKCSVFIFLIGELISGGEKKKLVIVWAMKSTRDPTILFVSRQGL